MANVIVKGVVYDTDGNTPITSGAVAVSVENSSGSVVGSGQSSTVNGAYSITYNSALLEADHWITVYYKRLTSSYVLGIGNLSGLIPNTINPQVPT